MIEGQCLCGSVSYIYHAELEKTILCYCQHCQRAQGTMCGWNSPVDKNKFEIVRGIKYLKEYFHSPNKARVFCQECGSPIYSYRVDLPDIVRLRLGTVTQGHIPAPVEQAFIQYRPVFMKVEG
ncbi:GFA family protein [Acinetobacter chinensis]|uniref:GFA family protein n=1 Tax=Acinetobacter chinensis TaxID=2004650 RepID=A0A3B7LWX2_9GAMM|nr:MULTISPECIES: GFA family protein [Acinetobacter]AXY56485.1 GFA family protein [Acinetobacter chinensis]AXY59874.1 GFA family protein [Acinetobacter sp. WCHAc010052]MDV2468163.1 GFA family protein [Acinetobacter chinensis]WOE42922.1 GFA family protein [Acinetobacter chinensis]